MPIQFPATFMSSATVSSFDPNTVTNKLFWLRQGVGMLDGSGNTVTANGTTVATWQDQTGNGNHFTGSGTYLDATGAGLGTGKGAISSDGSTNSFGRGSMTLTSNFTLFLVQKVTNDPNLIFRGSNGAYAVVSQNGSSVASDSLGASSSVIRLDGSPTSIATRGGVYTYTNNRFRLITFQATGSNFNGSTAVYFWDYGGFRAAGKFCEIFWVNKVVTGTELDDVENYFLTQYGIARTDPYFANVSLLLHMDSTFADSSSNSFTVTSNAVTTGSSGAKSGFGQYGDFPGTSDAALTISASSSFNFGTSNFTIEFWFNIPSGATGSPYGKTFISNENGSWGAGAFSFYGLASSTQFRPSFWVYEFSSSSPVLIPSSGDYRDGNWHHIAIVRNGSSFSMYIDGTLSASGTHAGNCGSSTRNLMIGDNLANNGGDRNLLGKIDEVRITNGVARYTSNFTPPTAPFPNS